MKNNRRKRLILTDFCSSLYVCKCVSRVCVLYTPSSWLAELVVRLNCCSRYLPRKAAKPATTAISIQAANTIHVNTGFDSRCLVTLGITGVKKKATEWRDGESGRETESSVTEPKIQSNDRPV